MTRLPCVAFAAVLSSTLAAQAHWTLLYPSASPTPRRGMQLVGDPVRGVVLLFGGMNTVPPGFLGELWQWNGATWTQLQVIGPSARSGAALAFDGARQRVVLFGGFDPVLYQRDDTWTWDGTNWIQRLPATRPPARDRAAMAYDAQRQVLVLFGGMNGAGNVLDDIWEWDGLDWQHRAASPRPLPRYGAAMSFDPVSQRVLLFGGQHQPSGAILGDTWTWDGTAWQQEQPATPPYPRTVPAMALDAARQRVVLHGGNNFDPFTWEWDGAEWRLLLLAGPGPNPLDSMAYDTVRAEMIHVHGNEHIGCETWVYRTDTPADFVPFGSGCAGSAGTPELTAPGGLAWLGDTFRTQVDAVAAGSPGAVFVNGIAATPPIDLAPVGLPGCSRFVTIDDTCFLAAANGIAEWVVTVPNDPFFAGVQFHQQVLVLDPAAPNGACVSNAATITIGIR